MDILPLVSQSIEGIKNIPPWFSLFVALCALLISYRNYAIAKEIREESKADDYIVLGKPSHPNLRAPYCDSVIRIPIFNKSRRKVHIHELAVYDEDKTAIPVDWSGQIDDLGTPQNPADHLGFNDSAEVYLRRCDGQRFTYARVVFSQSHSKKPCEVIFNPYEEFYEAARASEVAVQ